MRLVPSKVDVREGCVLVAQVYTAATPSTGPHRPERQRITNKVLNGSMGLLAAQKLNPMPKWMLMTSVVLSRVLKPTVPSGLTVMLAGST